MQRTKSVKGAACSIYAHAHNIKKIIKMTSRLLETPQKSSDQESKT